MGATRLWFAFLVTSMIATSMIATAASAQDYPTRPITLVNLYAAGGPVARLGYMDYCVVDDVFTMQRI